MSRLGAIPLTAPVHQIYDSPAVRKRARYIAIFVIILPIVLLTRASALFPLDESQLRILGKWDSRVRSKDSGITLQFFADGTVRENSDLESAGRYRLKDNHLTTYMLDAKGGEKQKVFDLTLEGDNITIKESTGGPEIHMERLCKGGSAVNDILGEWLSPNYPGATRVFPLEPPLHFPVFVEFTKDKKIFTRSTPAKITEGRYEISDGVLLLKFPNEPPMRTKVRIRPEQTDIRITSQGPEVPFRRVTASECATQATPVNLP
jgi:hypothetical protein